MIHEIEYSTAEQIQQYSLERLQETLAYLNTHSAYYKNALSGYELSEIKTIADIQQLPITTKEDLAIHNDDFLCVPKNEIADWITTSGTLGQPVSFGLTKQDLKRLAKNEARSLAISSCDPSDRIQLMVTLDKRFMAGLAYYLGAQEYGCATIRVGSGSPGLQIDSINRFHPNVIIAVPSFLLVILEYASEEQVKLINSLVEKIICIGEPVRKSDYTLNNLGSRIREKMPKAHIISTYASTEMATAITECSEGKGGHVPADLIYVELLDAAGRQVVEGQPGEVTVTTFGIEGMPLLRYRTGDVCILSAEECSCGNNTKRLSPVLGRKKQMIKYKGTTLFPEAIYEVLNGEEWINGYVIQLDTNNIGTDELTVYLSLAKDKDVEAALEALNHSFQAILRVKPAIVIKPREEIGKMRFTPTMRKPIKLIDNRANNLA